MSLGYSVSTATSRVASGEMDEIWTPRNPRSGTYGVIMCHGSGTPNEYIDLTAQPASVRLAAALATAGIPLIAGDFGNQTWGNDTAMSRIDSAFTVLKAQFPNMRTNKFCLLGISMGGGVAARYTQLHPSNVAAFCGIIPLLDIVAFYNANVAGSQAQVGTAWGVTAPAALPSSANVAANAALAASVPMIAGYSSVDTTVLPAWVTNYVAAINAAGGSASATVTDSTYGHSDQAVGGMPISTVGQFFAAHGA